MTIETVENLVKQQGVITKIWIVDQGSTSENLTKLQCAVKDYQNVYIKTLGQNVGVPGGRNIGIELGTAEYTVSIDNDAVLESSHGLANIVRIFESEPEIGIIGFRIMNYYNNKDDEYSWVYPKPLKRKRDERFLTTTFCGCGHAIRRSVFNQVAGYDADLFFYWEETDLSYRVINLGYKIIYEPSIRVLHKISPEARVRWEDRRFYYLVRNSIYMRLKYMSNKSKILTYVLGYLVKGSYNKLLPQTLMGIKDGFQLYQQLRPKLLIQSPELYTLTEAARLYLEENNFRHRGNFISQVKNDVLANMPGDSRSSDLSQSEIS
jgi:GT2 family glycosyltransferase